MILKGTKFQIKVWNYLKTIKKGSVLTYSDVAKGIHKPKAVRAVANAIGRNPSAKNEVFGIGILGFALTEAVALFALVIALLLLYTF